MNWKINLRNKHKEWKNVKKSKWENVKKSKET